MLLLWHTINHGQSLKLQVFCWVDSGFSRFPGMSALCSSTKYLCANSSLLIAIGQQCSNTSTNQVVPIYYMINFILCHQSHMTLLQDARSHVSTKLTSNHHHLVVARANTSHIFGHGVSVLILLPVSFVIPLSN